MELIEFLGSWDPKMRTTFIYGRDFHLTKDVVATTFGLVKQAPTKLGTQIFKAGLTFKRFQGHSKSNGFLRSQCTDPKLLDILDFLQAALWFSKAPPEIGKSQEGRGQRNSLT